MTPTQTLSLLKTRNFGKAGKELCMLLSGACLCSARGLTNSLLILQFLLIFRKAAAGELEDGSGLSELARLAEVDVDEVGVGGAAKFFEAKAKEQAFSNKFEAEIKQEQEERKKQAEEAKARKEAFIARKAAFGVS